MATYLVIVIAYIQNNICMNCYKCNRIWVGRSNGKRFMCLKNTKSCERAKLLVFVYLNTGQRHNRAYARTKCLPFKQFLFDGAQHFSYSTTRAFLSSLKFYFLPARFERIADETI